MCRLQQGIPLMLCNTTSVTSTRGPEAQDRREISGDVELREACSMQLESDCSSWAFNIGPLAQSLIACRFGRSFQSLKGKVICPDS